MCEDCGTVDGHVASYGACRCVNSFIPLPIIRTKVTSHMMQKSAKRTPLCHHETYASARPFRKTRLDSLPILINHPSSETSSTPSTVRRRPSIRFCRQSKLPSPSLAVTESSTASHSVSAIQLISTSPHGNANLLIRGDGIAVRACRDRLISIDLPDLAIEVSSIDWCTGIGV
jgi:hypothetical protein